MSRFLASQKNHGFNLIQLVIALGVMAILLAILLSSFRGMYQQAQNNQARYRLENLKSAVESYFRHHLEMTSLPYPDNITDKLTTATPTIIREVVADPFETNSATSPKTFGYSQSTDATKKYYVIWSRGVNKTNEWSWQPSPAAPTEVSLLVNSDDIAVSNLPVKQY